MKIHPATSPSSPPARISLHGLLSLQGLSTTLAVSALLIAPFTWSYVGTAGGMLVRAIDLVLIMAIVVMAARFRLVRLPLLVPSCLLAVACLYMVRSAVFSEMSALISGVKIIYYLVATLVLATAFKEISGKRTDRSTIYALLLASPIFYIFLSDTAAIFLELFQTRPLSSPSQIVFSGWNQVFSENLFGDSALLEVRGVAFRNSAGIAFLVAALYYYLWDGAINRIATIVLMVIAAMLFSRSVWLVQLLFVALVILRSSTVSRLFWLFLIACIAVILAFLPGLFEAFANRINSDFGRSEMLSAAIREFSSSTLFGSPGGAWVVLDSGEERPVHNVPLALALETGISGLLLSITIAAVFLYTAATRLFLLVMGRSEQEKITIVVILLSVILFVRPMISASSEIYFSIGEWCALAIFLAFVRETGGGRSRRHDDPGFSGAPTSTTDAVGPGGP